MVNYYLDISEEEYIDETFEVPVTDENDQPTGEMMNPTYVGFPYRSMKQVMITNMLPTLVWNVSITPIKAHYTMF